MKQTQTEAYLQANGLLCHSFAFNELPKHLQSSLTTARSINLNDSYLSLLANAGARFWTAMRATNVQHANTQSDPVDNFSITLTNQLLQIAALETHAQILYPNRFPVPLMALGEHIGWSKPSPLGLGLHKEFGPWFAYRALVKTTQPITVSATAISSKHDTSACITCIDTPCVNACPATAVSTTQPFNINRCADYRVKEDSTCKQQCHARNACPVGKDYQYSEEQRAYHMTHALSALISWSSSARPSTD